MILIEHKIGVREVVHHTTWNSLNSNSQSTDKAHKGERAINE